MTENNEQRIVSSAPRALSVDSAAAKPSPVETPFFSRAAWARILPFGTYIFFIILGDMLERAGFARAELRWLYPVQIGLVAVLLAVFWKQYAELRHAFITFRQAAIAIAAGVLVLVLWINLDAPWMVVGSSPGYDPRTAGEIDWLLAAVRIAGAALVDRSGGNADLGVPFFPLVSFIVPTYPADALPPELAAIPAEKPGSRKPA